MLPLRCRVSARAPLEPARRQPDAALIGVGVTGAPAGQQLGFDAHLVGEHQQYGEGVLSHSGTEVPGVGVGAGSAHRQLLRLRDESADGSVRQAFTFGAVLIGTEPAAG